MLVKSCIFGGIFSFFILPIKGQNVFNEHQNLPNNAIEITLAPSCIEAFLQWASYFGGEKDESGRNIISDEKGNIYITGETSSQTFPIQEGGGYVDSSNTSVQAYISKFSNNGVLLWSTYFGGNARALGQDIALDQAGNLYLCGSVESEDLPLIQSPGAYYNNSHGGGYDAFIAKFDPGGNLLWSTLYGADADDEAYSINCDSKGNVFVVGSTLSDNLPLVNPGNGSYFQSKKKAKAGFILKFDAIGKMLWATYFDGDDDDLLESSCIDKNDNLIINGVTKSSDFPVYSTGGAYFQSMKADTNSKYHDAFIAKFNNQGKLLWSTYFGGSHDDYSGNQPRTNYIDTDSASNIFITGSTRSTDFPVLNPGAGAYFQGTLQGSLDVFISKFSSGGTLLWSTFYGGTKDDRGFALHVDRGGTLYVGGMANNGLPLVNPGGGAHVQNYQGTYFNAFLARFNPLQTLTWATYSGGNHINWFDDFTTDKNNCLFVSGGWKSSNAYTVDPGRGTYYQPTNNSGSRDICLLKFCDVPIPKATTKSTALLCDGDSNATAQLIFDDSTRQYTYSWLPGGEQTASISGLSAGTYTVYAMDQDSNYYARVIKIAAPAPFQITAPPDTTITKGESIYLTMNDPGNYFWEPESGLDDPTSSSPLASPSLSSTYTVTVLDSNLCEATDSVIIFVKTNCDEVKEVFVPNAFSPNNDKQNDVLYVRGKEECISELQFFIYNRWGELVFETKDINKGWDGKHEQEQQNTEVFRYVLSVKFLNGKELLQHGNISLIR